MSKYVQLAKRENNNKRGFLIVNPYLGKHIAMSPNDILHMFDDVAALTPPDFIPEKTLVIGFAETATALGIHYAVKNNTYFIQTTRENIPSEYHKFYFSEEHSHATEQYIVKDAIDSIADNIDRIIFIDDEITTGNTVLNAIKAIDKAYDKNFKYEVVSILNSMNDEQIADYTAKHIGIYYLEKISNSDYEDTVKSFSSDGVYHKMTVDESKKMIGIYKTGSHLTNTRMLVKGKDYGAECHDKANELSEQLESKMNECPKINNILVLGTEEFMYSGLVFAEMLRTRFNKNVKFHATTRSPICVSKQDDYPLYERYELRSVYDDDRITYVYNLAKYDAVFIMIETECWNKKGINDLLNALGSTNVSIVAM